MKAKKRAPWSYHGMVGTRTYYAWRAMKQRCHNVKATNYKWYGGRGIKVCDRWRYSFNDFVADMKEAPSDNHTIERFDNDGNYEPGNCEWALMKEQAKNKRDRTDSVKLTYRSKTLTVTQWCQQLGIDRHTVYKRVRAGWSDKDALTLPKRMGVSSGGWRKIR